MLTNIAVHLIRYLIISHFHQNYSNYILFLVYPTITINPILQVEPINIITLYNLYNSWYIIPSHTLRSSQIHFTSIFIWYYSLVYSTFFQISLSVRDQESPTGEEASLHPTWTTRNLNQGIIGTKQGPAGLIEEINHQPKKSNHSQHSRRDHPRRSVPGPYRDPQTRYKLEISQIFLWENS